MICFFGGLLVGWGSCTLTFTFIAARWPGFFSGPEGDR
jgi:hypothetical protein